MSTYQGMRWFKCDLQVQTPEDANHWLDANLQLGDPRRPIVAGIPDESGIQEAARRFLSRCHELDLQVIAITDHNFSAKSEPRDWFLAHLVEQNRSVAKALGHDPLVIFPGFEVDIGYHVLCLFGPARKLSHVQRVSMILTKLGLPENERFRGGIPQPLRYNNQFVSLKKLLEVVQDEHRGIVIAAHADQKDGIFEDTRNIGDFLLPNLLCVELTQYPPTNRYAEILSGSNRNWSRKGRPPAVVQSSDAKSLQCGVDGKPKANALGYRYTWIKMSWPSIEALRQAFLDHESRIRLPEDVTDDANPAEREHQARILSLQVEGAGFVEDQEVIFSPNLNCIIGGRGSGKSTLLEYLRMTLGKDSSAEVGDDPKTREKIERIRRTLSAPKAEVRVRWLSRDGVEDTVAYRLPSGSQVEGRELIDLDTFLSGLPVRFLSQQQLTQLTEKEKNNLLPLIDAFAQDQMDALEAQERELRAELSRLFQVRRQKGVVEVERKRVEQELTELTRQWQARAGLKAAADAHQHRQEANKYIQRVGNNRVGPSKLIELAENLVESHSPLGSIVESWPHTEWFKDLDKKVEQAKERLLADARAVVEKYQQDLSDLFGKDPLWPMIEAELKNADAEFLAACRAQGLTPDEVSRMQEIDRSRRAKQGELEGKTRKIQELENESEGFNKKLTEIHELWQRQFDLRCDAARRAKEIGDALHQKFLDVTVEYCGDRRAFEAIWNRLAPDGRTSLGREWHEIGQRLFKYRSTSQASSVWAATEALVQSSQPAPADLAEWLKPLASHLRSEQVSMLWEQVYLQRTPDMVDLTLYRKDGTRAGSVQVGDLSDGQRNTAALALLLAQGDAPLVIDQPEDELDSNFIYRDLVPMLRGIKDQRQLIFSTHNANLPVNGDAELVYALETLGGKGKRMAVGGLDRAEVINVVLEIMEGSEEAFKKRREKYHF